VKKFAQSPRLSKIIGNVIFSEEKVAKKFASFSNFQQTAERQKSPNRRKFAQSGHPDSNNTPSILKFSRPKSPLDTSVRPAQRHFDL
jgi:hypothetical protein